MLYTISKGELWKVRDALETKDPEDSADALGIINSILEKNVTIEVTEEQMYNPEPDVKLTEDEQASLLTDEDLEELEEEHRVC